MRFGLLSVLALGVAAPGPASVPPGASGPPRLVVFIAIDQMRPDYFDRFGPQFTGGLKRLREGSAFFARGEQDHAITETAPGHATMLTGRSPGSVGIVTNEFGVPDSTAPLIGVPGPGASPARFRGTTLYDWMKAADPGTLVLSVSRKDRGAILPIGRAKVPVYWYSYGSFTTSSWYGSALPEWLQKWNARNGALNLAGSTWNLLLPDSAYAEDDNQPWERGGNSFQFPHQVSDDPNRAVVGDLLVTPWMDSLTIDLALEGVRQLKLGQRGKPDLLSISLSTTDAMGHVYGPDSREMHDHILRLDRWVGWLMDSLETTVGKGQILYVLTSDHGVTSFPEYASAHGRMGGRVSGGPVAWDAADSLQARYQRKFFLEFNNGLLLGDTVAIHRAGANVDSLARELASRLARNTGVTRIYTPKTLAQASDQDLDAMRWRRSIPADFPWLAAASLSPGYLWTFSPAATTHGTTNADDVRVPILFMGQGIVPGKYERARTVDIAPTIAALLGIKPLEAVEGVPLPEVTGKK